MTKRFLIVLVLGDIILSVLALHIGSLLRLGASALIKYRVGLGGVAIFVFVLIFSSFLSEIYDYDKNKGRKESLLQTFVVLATAFLILSMSYYVMPEIMFGRGVLFLSLSTFGTLQFLWHVGYRSFLNGPGFAKRVIILGAGPLAKQIGELITSTNHHHVLSGYVNLTNEPAHVPLNAIVGNGNGGLIETMREKRAHKLVVSLSERRGVFPCHDVLDCKFSGVEVIDAPSFYEEMTGKLLIENITPSWFIFSSGFKLHSSMKVYKRIFDIFFSTVAIIFALPLIPLIALIIKIDSSGPIFFRQVRLGVKEKTFVLYKFRTMMLDAENGTGAIWAQKDDPRITTFGRFLRKTRLDEIPQLYNVLKGEMSFIGPRPERPEFVQKLKEIIPYYSERHIVKPGLTGWAQVKYPYGSSVNDAIEKLRYDLFYIKNFSLFLDLLIIIETVKVVIFGRGGR